MIRLDPKACGLAGWHDDLVRKKALRASLWISSALELQRLPAANER
jgi:hypothetical protein